MASQMTAAQAAAKKKNSKQEEEEEVNIDQLMDDIKKDIYFAYNNKDYCLGDTTDLNSKQAIQLLHEIELKVTTYINEIEYIQNAEKNADNAQDKHVRKDWNKLLEKKEQERKEARFAAQKKIKEEATKLKNEKVQANLDERMARQVKKIGKQDMYRSQKPKVNIKTEKKVIDEDTQD